MPSFPLLQSLSRSTLAYNHFLGAALPEPGVAPSSNITIANREVLEILEQLSVISEAIKHSHFQGDREAISNSIYVVEYKLSILNFGEDVESLDSDRFDVSKALGLAAHLYLHLGIRELPANARRYKTLFRRLEKVVSFDMDLMHLSAPQINFDLLLWVLFITSVGATDELLRSWVILRLQQLCSVLGIKERKEFDIHLRTVAWLDPFSSFYAQKLWDEIAQFPVESPV
jgi:hypothetical protein